MFDLGVTSQHPVLTTFHSNWFCNRQAKETLNNQVLQNSAGISSCQNHIGMRKPYLCHWKPLYIVQQCTTKNEVIFYKELLLAFVYNCSKLK